MRNKWFCSEKIKVIKLHNGEKKKGKGGDTYIFWQNLNTHCLAGKMTF